MLAACSDKGAPPAPVPPPVDPPRTHARDAGIIVQSPNGLHLDDDVGHRPAVDTVGYRAGRAIDVTLRSTPTGASAAVDGVPVGQTPTFWAGNADGRPHE